MIQPPYYAYQSTFDAKLYRKSFWPALKGLHGKLMLHGLQWFVFLILVMAVSLLIVLLFLERSGWPAVIAVAWIYAIAVAVIMPYRLQHHARESLIRQFDGKQVNNWFSDTHFFLNNPVSQVITVYPFKIMTLTHTDPEYFIFHAADQYIFLSRAGLQAAGLEEKFLSLVNAPKN